MHVYFLPGVYAAMSRGWEEKNTTTGAVWGRGKGADIIRMQGMRGAAWGEE